MDTDDQEDENLKGIPQFWLTTLRNHPQLQTVITERDEEALGYLSDVRCVDVLTSFLHVNPDCVLTEVFA